MPRFDGELSFHENFEDHQQHAGRRVVYVEDALEVWENLHCRQIGRNRRLQRAPYLVRGCNNVGRRAAIAIIPVNSRRGIWCAYTAWWIT